MVWLKGGMWCFLESELFEEARGSTVYVLCHKVRFAYIHIDKEGDLQRQR